jgi:hypothetical protein
MRTGTRKTKWNRKEKIHMLIQDSIDLINSIPNTVQVNLGEIPIYIICKFIEVGQNDLREVFMKTDNHVGGKYFAEVMKEVLSDVEVN